MIKTYREQRDEIGSQKELWGDIWSRQTLSEDYFAGVKWDQYPGVLAKHLPQDAVVLEAGCGLGKYVVHLDRQGHKMVGIDLDERALVRAHQYDAHLLLLVADVAQLPFPDDSFDAYVSLGVIEHFKGGGQHILGEARRILKSHGLIFVSVPYLHLMKRLSLSLYSGDLHQRVANFSQGAGRADKVFYQYVFTREEIVQVMKEAGFIVVETALCGTLRWFLNLELVRKLRSHSRPPTANTRSVNRPVPSGIARKRRGRIREHLKDLALLVQRFIPGWLSAHMIMVVGRLE
jgi:ubiquinone/menaquinone biosynthesis C-methylase UbiE